MDDQLEFYEKMLDFQNLLKERLQKDGYADLEIMEAIEIEIRQLQHIVLHVKSLYKNRN